MGVDLETVGKETRQAGLETWFSQHCAADIPGVRDALTHAQLFARSNPLPHATRRPCPQWPESSSGPRNSAQF